MRRQRAVTSRHSIQNMEPNFARVLSSATDCLTIFNSESMKNLAVNTNSEIKKD